ncbi:Sulfiredoxin-1 [Sciurus carolinensis]|uniref:Sulfiredoxin-1 n=1 Tax=Sciurus carolinensis TaxID=30640 RepID=A0AA41T368_SCICA|nr:Sulfiredoxin-1 [Sciurus carolinensis]
MGLRAGGSLGRAGASRGAPEGPGSSGGAQGGSIHSGCIAAVHNVPLSVLIRPLPSVLDPAKVQSLVDTIRVRPRGSWRAKGGIGRREDARWDWFQALPELGVGCVTLNKWPGLSGLSVSSFEQEGNWNR